MPSSSSHLSPLHPNTFGRPDPPGSIGESEGAQCWSGGMTLSLRSKPGRPAGSEAVDTQGLRMRTLFVHVRKGLPPHFPQSMKNLIFGCTLADGVGNSF